MSVQTRSRIRTLLVDDNPTFHKALTELLGRYPELAIVGAASDGAEALAQAQLLQPHVVLIDLTMPRMSGMEAIPQLRTMLPEAGIIALTLLTGEAYREAALAAGADGFIPKDALVTELFPAIQTIVSNGRFQGQT